MEKLNNSKGFTLISLILALSILVLLIPFLSFLIQSTHYSTKYNDYSVTQFFYFLRDDLLLATDFKIDQNKIIFNLQSGEIATISQHGEVIRRQVENKGHEIYLRNIQYMKIQHAPLGFVVNVTTTKGEHYEKVFIFYK